MNRVELPSRLDIASAGDLRETFLSALRNGAAVEVRAADVKRADAAGLQVLAAFCRDARARGIGVRFITPSLELTEASRLFGLDSLLADIPAAAGGVK